MRCCRLALSIVLLPLLLVSCAPSAKSWKLSVHPRPGSTRQFALSSEVDLGARVPVLGTQSGRASVRVEATQRVAERRRRGPLTMELTYDRVRFDLTFRDDTMRYDSAEPSSNENEESAAIRPYLDRILGETVTFELSRAGEVSQVRGLEELLDETPPGLDPAIDALRRSLGPELFGALLQLVYPVYPDQPVRIGDAWESELDLPDPAFGTMEIDFRYEVRGAERRNGRKCVKLDLVARIDIRGGGPMLERFRGALGGNGEIRVETEQASGAGTLWVDRRTGLIEELDMHQQMTLRLSVPIKILGFQRRVDVKVDIDQKISLNRLELTSR